MERILQYFGMRNSNLQRQYYNDLSHSRYSSQTSRKLKSIAPRSQFNDTKTRFLTRIEKACTTMSNNDISKELGLYRRQIERLEKQILKKDKIIFEIKSTTALNKELEAELIETYRIIYMYEGKINQYEKELKKMEIALSKSSHGELGKKVEELLESFRLENGELMGRVEESNRIIFQLQQKLKKVENKYFDTAWKLSSTKREITNPLKKKFPNLRNTITIKQTPLLEKEKALKGSMKNQSARQGTDDYQITQVRPKATIAVEKQAIRFKRFETRPQEIPRIHQSSQRHLASPQENTSFTKNSIQVKAYETSNQPSKRESPLTERKVYASPITRYELNRKVEEVSNMMDSPHKHRISMSSSQHQGPNAIYY